MIFEMISEMPRRTEARNLYPKQTASGDEQGCSEKGGEPECKRYMEKTFSVQMGKVHLLSFLEGLRTRNGLFSHTSWLREATYFAY